MPSSSCDDRLRLADLGRDDFFFAAALFGLENRSVDKNREDTRLLLVVRDIQKRWGAGGGAKEDTGAEVGQHTQTGRRRGCIIQHIMFTDRKSICCVPHHEEPGSCASGALGSLSEQTCCREFEIALWSPKANGILEEGGKNPLEQNARLTSPRRRIAGPGATPPIPTSPRVIGAVL